MSREKSMKREIVRTIALPIIVLAVLAIVLSAAWPVQAQDAKAPYPSMAPVEQYLMANRNAEIALARSAAPDAISGDAKILVLGRHGYETAAEGKNGFVCVVERGWMSPSNAPEFWNPKLRGPVHCFQIRQPRDPFCRLTYKRTELAIGAGKTKAEIIEGNKAAFEKGELPPLEPGSMSYMMSKGAYLTDRGDHNVAHLMFYAPPLDGKAWGADLTNSPVMLNPQFDGVQPIDVFIVPVGRWSDGSAAPVM